MANPQNNQTIVQLKNPTEGLVWYPITDQLRFGDKGSTAFFAIDENKASATFSGELKLNEGAGFASYRTAVKLDLSQFDEIQIKVQGDGREYKALIKDLAAKNSGQDYSYQMSFTTLKNKSNHLHLNLKKFTPVYRGRIDLPLPAFNPAEIEELGFQINDKNPGPYKIEFGEWTAVRSR